MEFLREFLRRHLVGKPVVASANVGCLKLHYRFISFNLSNVGEFFWSLILKDCLQEKKKKKENRLLASTSLPKRKIRDFHVVDEQR